MKPKLNLTKEMKMIVKNEDEMINDMKIVVEELQATYKVVWEKDEEARVALYGLISDCVDFARLLNTEVKYQDAFKRIINFRWNKHTKLSTLITKTVFGVSNRNAYAYAQVIDAATKAGIDNEGDVKVADWIEQNGGVNKIIRKTKSGTQASEDRNYRVEVGRNAKLYGVTCKIDEFECAELSRTFSKDKSEVVVLLSRNAETGKLSLVWTDDSDEKINMMYEDLGEMVMRTETYHERKLEVAKIIQKQKNDANKKVLDELKRISYNSKSKLESSNDDHECDDAA
jgi:hypothetical protein